MALAVTDLFRLAWLPPGAVVSLASLTGREHLDDAFALGRGVIVITGHLGGYELGGAFLAALGYPVHGMVEDLDHETNEALARYRGATGMRLVSRNSGTRSLLRLLRDGQVVLLVADRVVGRGGGAEGLLVDFAGGRRRVPTGPAALSLATGAPILVGLITRNHERGPRYRVRLEPPIMPGVRSPAATRALTRTLGERLGDAVRAHPDEWYVFQPGWVTRDGDA